MTDYYFASNKPGSDEIIYLIKDLEERERIILANYIAFPLDKTETWYGIGGFNKNLIIRKVEPWELIKYKLLGYKWE